MAMCIRKILLVLIIQVMGSAGIQASSSWADGLFDELSKDFGIVSRGVTLVHKFRLKNDSSQPVGISSVRVSCGCVSASALKTFLQPGEETSVVARMDSTRFRGVKTVTIYVHFNKPKSEEVRLWIKANARDDFSLSPDMLDLGVIKQGQSAQATSVVKFHGQPDLIVGEVHPESNYLVCKIRETGRSENESTYELTVSLRKDVPPGVWFSDVWIRTDSAQIPQVRVPVTLTVEAPLNATPGQIQLGQIQLGMEIQRRLVIRGLAPFHISKIEGVGGLVNLTNPTKEAKSVHVLTLSVQPDPKGKVPTAVRIHTDAKDQAILEIPVLGELRP